MENRLENIWKLQHRKNHFKHVQNLHPHFSYSLPYARFFWIHVFFPREKQREASCWRNYANATWLHGGRPTFTTEIYPSGYVDWVTIPLENIGIYLSPSYSGKYIPVGNLGKYYKQKNGTISGLCRVTSESTKNVLVLPLIFLSKKWHFGGIVLFYTSGRQQL